MLIQSPSIHWIIIFVLPEAPTPNGPESQPGVEEVVVEKEEDGSEDEWEQVGPRNKTSITRQADFIRTPITDIFGGHIRCVFQGFVTLGHVWDYLFHCFHLKL